MQHSACEGGAHDRLCFPLYRRELQYVLEDAEVSAVLASERHADRVAALAQVPASPGCLPACGAMLPVV